MRQLRATAKLSLALAVAACILAGTAISASAFSIEPLNTKFTGTSTAVDWQVEGGGGEWAQIMCEKSTLSGTTNITKTPFVKATPAFSGCSDQFFDTVTFSNSCAVEGTVPWELTVTEKKSGSTTSYWADVKLNCSLVAKVVGWASCKFTLKAGQTSKKGLVWTNTASGSRLLFTTTEPFTYESAGTCPLWVHKTSGKIWMFENIPAAFTVEGIKVV